MSPDFEGKELYLKPPVEILSLDATQQRLLKQVQQVEKELNLAQLKVEVSTHYALSMYLLTCYIHTLFLCFYFYHYLYIKYIYQQNQ